jgi:hypothetical protein
MMEWLKTGFKTMPNIELCHLTKITSSGLNAGGDDNGKNKGNDRRSNGKRVREDERKKDKKTIKSLTQTIATLSCKTDDPESSSDEASVASEASEPPVKSNWTNSRLTRQKGSRK